MPEPSVFVLGAPLCGVTGIAECLSRQREVFVPSIGGTHFFCDDTLWANGLDWYRREFFHPNATGNRRIFCDATSSYLASREAIDRLAEYSDAETSYIVVLGDPVERAWSAYWSQRSVGAETLDFEAALDAEPERVERARASGERWWQHAYVTMGRFSDQLSYAADRLGAKRMLVLGPPDLTDTITLQARLRAHIGLHEIAADELSDAPFRYPAAIRSDALHRMIHGENAVKTVARRLLQREVRTRLGKRILARNAQPGHTPPMDASTRSRLTTLFAPDIDALAAFTGRWATDLRRAV